MNKDVKFPITGKFKFNKHGRLLVKHDGEETLSLMPWNAKNLIGAGLGKTVIGGRIILQEDKDNPGWYELAGLIDAKALSHATERSIITD